MAEVEVELAEPVLRVPLVYVAMPTVFLPALRAHSQMHQ